MKILAFDQATTKTGYALFTNGSYLCHGLIDCHSEPDVGVRIEQIVGRISNVIAVHRPDIVVIEDTAMQRNVKVLRLLAQLQGMVLGCCMTQGIPCKIRKPAYWRKYLHFTQGRAKSAELKRQAQQIVKRRYNLTVSEDEADAICIGLSYCIEIGDTIW